MAIATLAAVSASFMIILWVMICLLSSYRTNIVESHARAPRWFNDLILVASVGVVNLIFVIYLS